MQRITIFGHVGADPRQSFTHGGKEVAEIRVGCNAKDKEGNKVTTWYRASFFERQAEAVRQYVTKGSGVIIEGDLEIELWTDKEGVTHATPCIRFPKFTLTDKNPQANGTQQAVARAQTRAQSGANLDALFADPNEIPF